MIYDFPIVEGLREMDHMGSVLIIPEEIQSTSGGERQGLFLQMREAGKKQGDARFPQDPGMKFKAPIF